MRITNGTRIAFLLVVAACSKSHTNTTGDGAIGDGATSDAIPVGGDTGASDAAPPFARVFGVAEYQDVAFDVGQYVTQGGIRAVWLQPYLHQTSNTSSDVVPDTPISLIADQAQAAVAAGLTVIMKPTCQGTGYQGDVDPDDLDTWFANYEATYIQYADVVWAAGGRIFVLMTEANDIDLNRHGGGYGENDQRFRHLIAHLRARYPGILLTHAPVAGTAPFLSFNDALDILGADEYVGTSGGLGYQDWYDGWTLDRAQYGAPGYLTDALGAFGGNGSYAEFNQTFQAHFAKPLLITETGWPIGCDPTQPEAYSPVATGGIDDAGQAAGLQAFLDANAAVITGFDVWTYPPYDIINRSAAGVLKQWSATH